MGEGTAILLVGHGSRVEESIATTRAMAAMLAAEFPDAIVRIAFLELASPTFAEALAECLGAHVVEVVVQPFLLAPGRHSLRDLPDLIEQARVAHPAVRFRLGEVLGADPELVPILLRRLARAK